MIRVLKMMRQQKTAHLCSVVLVLVSALTLVASSAAAPPAASQSPGVAVTSPNMPPGPIPKLHVGAWVCSDWWISDCGVVEAFPGTDMYYTYYGSVSPPVTCTERPWGHLPNEHFPYPGQQVLWRVECIDAQDNGFTKWVTVRPPQGLPPGPIPELHIGNWICRDWWISDCGVVDVAPGTDMWYSFYGHVFGGVTCTETPWGHFPNEHFPYPPAFAETTWYVLCLDQQGEGFDKTVKLRTLW